ncbi:MAG TPA: urease subunit alpha [Streptosporangiaceae bacterium]
MAEIGRGEYAGLYGPAAGDRLRLADTGLVVRIEADDTSYGDEVLGGCGKTLRDGMLATSRPAAASRLDMLISNVVLIDPVLGVRKTSIGIKDGRIAGVARAGNPDVVDDVTLVIDSHTALIPGEGLIATPGTIDSHVHLSSPALIDVALSAGVTTLIGMGLGGVWDVGVNPERNLARMIDAWRDVPLNVGFLARGSASHPGLLERAAQAGAAGFKVHEDFGAYPAIIDTCLSVARQADLPVALHTDTLNEAGLLADTVAAIGGRTVHAYHIEGSGGGHPRLLELVSEPGVIGSSTTPTIAFGVNTLAELMPMAMTVHRMSGLVDSDLAVTRSRVRQATVEAENFLHDLGAIPIMNSDSMGMGRIGELVRRAWQLASRRLAAGDGDAAGAGPKGTGNNRENEESGAGPADNERVLRYLAKLTINPALTHGLADHVGSLEPGKLADVVLWQPALFGAKPELVVKAGFVAWGASGDGAGSTRLGQPRGYRSFFGGMGDAPAALSVVFASAAALAAGLPGRHPGRQFAAVSGASTVSRADLRHNPAVPRVQVPLDGSAVLVDGRAVRVAPASRVPLGQLYHLA